ncbi:MAG: MATE family efflux transporter, partial [Angelakisella sp.]
MMFSRRDLVKLIIPLIIEQTLAVTIGMADTIMVTTVGEAAVSGISIVDSINILLINIFAALATGGAIVVAQYLGKEDGPSAKTA